MYFQMYSSVEIFLSLDNEMSKVTVNTFYHCPLKEKSLANKTRKKINLTMVSPGHRHNVIGSQMSARTYQYSQLAFSAHTWVRNAVCTKRDDTTKARRTDRPTETLFTNTRTALNRWKRNSVPQMNSYATLVWRLLRWTALICVCEPFCSYCSDLLPLTYMCASFLQVIPLCNCK